MKHPNNNAENPGYDTNAHTHSHWFIWIIIIVRMVSIFVRFWMMLPGKVLAAGEFDHKTTDNVLIVLEQAMALCEVFHPILAVVTDHGTEFCVNRCEAKGCAAHHKFEEFLKEHGIVHILCGVNHSAD